MVIHIRFPEEQDWCYYSIWLSHVLIVSVRTFCKINPFFADFVVFFIVISVTASNIKILIFSKKFFVFVKSYWNCVEFLFTLLTPFTLELLQYLTVKSKSVIIFKFDIETGYSKFDHVFIVDYNFYNQRSANCSWANQCCCFKDVSSALFVVVDESISPFWCYGAWYWFWTIIYRRRWRWTFFFYF